MKDKQLSIAITGAGGAGVISCGELLLRAWAAQGGRGLLRKAFGPQIRGGEAAALLNSREPHPELAAHPALPDDTRLWAALQTASGGTWSGCVFDTDQIIEVLEAGMKALNE